MEMKLELKLISLVTQWDTKQCMEKGYNPYALGQYFQAVEHCLTVLTDYDKTIEDGLKSSFNGPLLNYLIKNI